jgi:hypothetical protein
MAVWEKSFTRFSGGGEKDFLFGAMERPSGTMVSL